MTEEEFKRLNYLRKMYQHATCVCDPIEFASRQKKLLYEIADFLLVPLVKHEEEMRKKEE